MHACVHVYMYACACILAYTCMHMHAHIYIYIYMHQCAWGLHSKKNVFWLKKICFLGCFFECLGVFFGDVLGGMFVVFWKVLRVKREGTREGKNN